MADGKAADNAQRFDAVVDLARRRGFFQPAAEIYGALAGFFDYGPAGAAMRRKMEQSWIDYWTRREGFFLIDTPTIAPEGVFRASGHLEKFCDPMAECKKCGETFRTDELAKQAPAEARVGSLRARGADALSDLRVPCPKGGVHEFLDPRQVSLMFATRIGAAGQTTGYLRPETAQGIFWNFPNLLRNNRGKLPFGVCQIGLGYRNEIAPRQALFRMREFHMAEVEVFIDPDKRVWPRFSEVQGHSCTFHARDGAVHYGTFADMASSGVIRSQATAHFMAATYEILRAWGMREEKMRYRQHMPDEMAHYAEDCWDLELETSIGWIECVGVADRGCFDLTQHQKFSGTSMEVFEAHGEPSSQERYALVPDFRALGPKFRGEAAAVGEAIRGAPPSALQADGSLHLKVQGKDVVVASGLFRSEKRVEKVTGRSFIPAVIEPSFGLDRLFFALLDCAWRRIKKQGEDYTILSLDPRVAPTTVAVFPLMAKDGLDALAQQIYRDLVRSGLDADYDDSGTIGKRYARADEVGTPFALTVDYESLQDGAVTLRFRDTQAQERLKASDVAARIRALMEAPHREGGS